MKTIVVATDFSEASGATLQEATKLAEVMKARILLVFVQNTTDVRYALARDIPIDFESSAELKKELAKYIAKKFGYLIRKYGRSYSKLETLILRGIPWEELNKLARKRKADLVVVGSRGLSPLKTFFVGSTTENLIRTSPCPVVVIHKSKKAFRKKAAA